MFFEPAESSPRLKLPIRALIRTNLSFAPWASASAYQVAAFPNNKEEVTVISAYVAGAPIAITIDRLFVLLVFEMCVEIEQVLVLRLKLDTWYEAPFELGHVQSEPAIATIGVEQAGDRIGRLGVDEGVEEDLAGQHPLVHVHLR